MPPRARFYLRAQAAAVGAGVIYRPDLVAVNCGLDRACPGDVAEIRLDVAAVEEHLPGVVEAFFFTNNEGEATARGAADAFERAYPLAQQGRSVTPVVYLDFFSWEEAPFVLSPGGARSGT